MKKQINIEDLLDYCPGCKKFFDKEGNEIKNMKELPKVYKVRFDKSDCERIYEDAIRLYEKIFGDWK